MTPRVTRILMKVHSHKEHACVHYTCKRYNVYCKSFVDTSLGLEPFAMRVLSIACRLIFNLPSAAVLFCVSKLAVLVFRSQISAFNSLNVFFLVVDWDLIASHISSSRDFSPRITSFVAMSVQTCTHDTQGWDSRMCYGIDWLRYSHVRCGVGCLLSHSCRLGCCKFKFVDTVLDIGLMFSDDSGCCSIRH